MTSEQALRIIADELAAGYGVEDIQVRHQIPAERARACVSFWRTSGKLMAVLANGSKVV